MGTPGSRVQPTTLVESAPPPLLHTPGAGERCWHSVRASSVGDARRSQQPITHMRAARRSSMPHREQHDGTHDHAEQSKQLHLGAGTDASDRILGLLCCGYSISRASDL